MKTRTLVLAASLTILLSISQGAFAGSVKVIANSTVTADSISSDELKNIFLLERNWLRDGAHVEPVLQKDGSAHEAFLKEILHQTDDSLRNYYGALVFTGKGSMPKTLGSDGEVVAYVARTRGAIGYVSATADAEGVKTLFIADTRESIDRKVITRIEPVYPETLLRLGIGGTVRLKVTISPKGNVEEIELLGGNPILAESAMIAVKQWTYAVRPSRTTTQVSVPFDPHR